MGNDVVNLTVLKNIGFIGGILSPREWWGEKFCGGMLFKFWHRYLGLGLGFVWWVYYLNRLDAEHIQFCHISDTPIRRVSSSRLLFRNHTS